MKKRFKITVIATVLSITKFISWELKKDNYTQHSAYSIGNSFFYYNILLPISKQNICFFMFFFLLQQAIGEKE